MIYTDVFGSYTLPPAQLGYAAFSFTSDAAFVWPYNTTGGNALAKINEISTSPNISLTLPDARQVSVGEDFLLRNVGANTYTVKDASGNTIATVGPSTAKYFYLADNITAAGGWAVLTYGSGASAVDAGQLAGYGIKALHASLNQAYAVVDIPTPVMINATHRAQVVNYTGGVATLPLAAANSLGNDFFFVLKNSGSGTLTVDPNGAELIDGQLSLTVQPGESTFLVCSGASWFTIGLGRSMQYNFTQLVMDVTSGSPFTLTATQASNKLLTFIGSPTEDVTVNVPPVVAVYYVYNNLSTAHSVTVKTATGAGAAVSQGQRAILFCDGTNVVSAQSAAVTSSISLVDGSALSPSLNFASKTNSGIFKYGIGIGFSVDGNLVGYFDNTGFHVTNLSVSTGNVVTIGDVIALVVALG